jgi:hypothetical protein
LADSAVTSASVPESVGEQTALAAGASPSNFALFTAVDRKLSYAVPVIALIFLIVLLGVIAVITRYYEKLTQSPRVLAPVTGPAEAGAASQSKQVLPSETQTTPENAAGDKANPSQTTRAPSHPAKGKAGTAKILRKPIR